MNTPPSPDANRDANPGPPPPGGGPDWQQVRPLFEAASALTGAARQDLLDDPAHDRAVVAEVRSLLAFDEGPSQLDQPVPVPDLPAAAAPSPPPPAAREGQRLGPWRITTPLGSGGMGEVWAAERSDGRYQGQAAVKLLKRGMDSDAVLARFAQEQQALARLAHPHIAHLLDAGLSPDGLPYFVMERVHGRPIDQACEGQPLESRLALFLQLADAVSHAHRNLLVHRDLKPGNVLVSDDGQVKLLDFGIAKALAPDADGATTHHGPRPFTPLFASPEQVRGEPVSTATDIYSLGVLLYVLLTGQRPYGRQAHTPAEVVKSVLEEEPTRPSSLTLPSPGWEAARRALQGDLDNILLKTLEKRPEARYPNVDALAADLRAFLEGRPVSARAASPGYVLGKFLRRHRAAAVAAALGGLGLLTGLAATLLQGRVVLALGAIGLSSGLVMALAQARQARLARDEAARLRDEAQRARDGAERHLADMRRMANAMVFDVNDALERGVTEGRRQLVLAAAQSLQQQAGIGSLTDAERIELAQATSRLAKLEGHAYADNIGDRDSALVHYRQALQLLEPLAPRHTDDAEWHGAMVSALEGLSSLLRSLNQREEGLATMQRVAVHAARAAALKPEDMRWRAFECAAHIELSAHNYMVSRDHGLNRVQAAVDHIADALACAQRLVRDMPEHPRGWKLLTLALRNQGGLLAIVGRFEASLQAQRASLEALERSIALPGGDLQRTLYPATLQHVAMALERLGELDEPSRLYGEAFELLYTAQRDDASNQRLRMEFFICAALMLHFELRRWAFDRFDAVLARVSACVAAHPMAELDPISRRQVMCVLSYGVVADAARGRLDAAVAGVAALHDGVRSAGLDLGDTDPNDSEMRGAIAIAECWCDAAHGRHAAAVAAAGRAQQAVQRVYEARAPEDMAEHLAAVEALVRLARAPFGSDAASQAQRAAIVAQAREFEQRLVACGAVQPGARAESAWLALQG